MHQFLLLLDGPQAAFEPYVAFDERVHGDDHSAKITLFHYVVFNGLVPVQRFDSPDAALAAAREFNRRHREAKLPKLLWRKLTCRWIRSHTAGAWLIEVTSYVLTDHEIETHISYEISLPGKPSIRCDTLEEAEAHVLEHERLTDERSSGLDTAPDDESVDGPGPNGGRSTFTP